MVIADWPKAVSVPGADAPGGFRDDAAEQEIATLQQVVTEVRRFKGDQGLKAGQRVPARLTLDGTALAAHEPAIRQLLKLQPEGEGFTATATLPVAGAEVALDLSGAIDVAAERKRLAKDLAAAEKDKAQSEGKLGNEAFLAKAPDHVVDKIKGRLRQGGRGHRPDPGPVGPAAAGLTVRTRGPPEPQGSGGPRAFWGRRRGRGARASRWHKMPGRTRPR